MIEVPDQIRHCLCELSPISPCIYLTLKVPITTAADDIFCNIFPNSRKKSGMIFHENRLPADDSHEMLCLICYF